MTKKEFENLRVIWAWNKRIHLVFSIVNSYHAKTLCRRTLRTWMYNAGLFTIEELQGYILRNYRMWGDQGFEHLCPYCIAKAGPDIKKRLLQFLEHVKKRYPPVIEKTVA